MFRSRLTLFRISGIAIRLVASWIVLTVLVTVRPDRATAEGGGKPGACAHRIVYSNTTPPA